MGGDLTQRLTEHGIEGERAQGIPLGDAPGGGEKATGGSLIFGDSNGGPGNPADLRGSQLWRHSSEGLEGAGSADVIESVVVRADYCQAAAFRAMTEQPLDSMEACW